MDFTKYSQSHTFFGGSERKLGIIINKTEYMLKFQKKTPFGHRNNHISEYIGSHIFELLDIETHQTYLGTYKGEQVVACKNFIPLDYQFVPFNDIGESSIDGDSEINQYSYCEIMRMLESNRKLTNVKETIDVFWKLFIIDAFIGNFDRHGGNWGFLKKNNQYRIAPIFDNGSCLFPNLTDENEMQFIMASKKETDNRIYKFPTSQIKLNGKKSSYFEVIHSLQFPECNKALAFVFKKIDLLKINKLIDETCFITSTQKLFYKYILNERYEKILKVSYNALCEVNKNE